MLVQLLDERTMGDQLKSDNHTITQWWRFGGELNHHPSCGLMQPQREC